jgi:hypothetical protein
VGQSPSVFFNLNELNHLFRGGVAMVKQMLNRVGVKTALVTLGWLSFFMSFLINDVSLVVCLQTVARVLP